MHMQAAAPPLQEVSGHLWRRCHLTIIQLILMQSAEEYKKHQLQGKQYATSVLSPTHIMEASQAGMGNALYWETQLPSRPMAGVR